MTVRDLITGSLRLLGAIATGEVPTASEAEDALFSLNDMISSWNLQRNFIYAILPNIYTLTAGQQAYTLGPSGAFNQPRPNGVESAEVNYTTGGQQIDIPLAMLSLDEWNALSVKSVTSTFPTQMYADKAAPLTNVYFYPIPQIAIQVTLYTWQPLAQFPSINAQVTLPDGYARALRYNLAVELAAEYGRPVSQEIQATAMSSIADIKRLNAVDYQMSCDPGTVRHPREYFNWLTG